jgi:superfamily I DNA/RNA helicase
MEYSILVDKESILTITGSNIYQSLEFSVGEDLAKVLLGNRGIKLISSKLTPMWSSDSLYLLRSRPVSSYLLIKSSVLLRAPIQTETPNALNESLHIFQKICRFAMKIWNYLPFSPTEKWSQKTNCGVVFPMSFSRNNGFRIALSSGFEDHRIISRHGTNILFAFASGTNEEYSPTEQDNRLFRRAFVNLAANRMCINPSSDNIEINDTDEGFCPLVLTIPNRTGSMFNTYDNWLKRLTKDQKKFVLSEKSVSQRVEGPAGSGKTLCLVLRAFYLCKKSETEGKECRILFLAHNNQTRNSIEYAFDALGEPFFHKMEKNYSSQNILISTLLQWAGNFLGEKEISNAQFIDHDALEAKEMRKYLIEETLGEILNENQAHLEKILSAECYEFFTSEDHQYIVELLQHEIGVMIKGRAMENLEKYVGLSSLIYGLPIKTDSDKKFVFSIYSAYQEKLNASGVFDTDDIVLTLMGRLNTPIWRRRCVTEGFNAIFVDETHMFNFNELSIFHHLLSRRTSPHIVFSIDRSQALGERGITTRMVREMLTGEPENIDGDMSTNIIFRNSPAIVRLAESITSSGATLFTTFENPLHGSSSVFTASDEMRAKQPMLWACANDEVMLDALIARIKAITAEIKSHFADVLIVATSEELIQVILKKMELSKIKCEKLLTRGDIDLVHKAARENSVVLSHPDFVGGLEFDIVFIVGLDVGRVPPVENSQSIDSRHFLEFKTFNRLYVAVSRARLVVEMFYSKERGRSPFLEHALDRETITENIYRENE